jgi:integrase
MAKISARKDNNKLFFSFNYQGKRYRETSTLNDTKSNRKKLNSKLKLLEAALSLDSFNYMDFFPNSQTGKKLSKNNESDDNTSSIGIQTVLFEEYIIEWLEVNQVNWRKSHAINILGMVNKYYFPAFGDKVIGNITRSDLLKFRTTLTKVPGRNGRESLTNNTINKIMDPLRRIFEEAADRYQFTTPFIRIKPLKIPKSDVQPFSINEVTRILNAVRSDYRLYYTVRFFTGLRTGEIDGLKWKYVDFEHRLIKIRETVVAGEESYTKTDASQRDVFMSDPVYKALQAQFQITGPLSKFVFCQKNGECIDHNNVTKRVWYPLLKRLGLEKRRPYQTRHTAATLWLASGESPEWIAKQMGHSTTEMLFKVYSRYVPNLTRRDGSAMDKLLSDAIGDENA